MNIKKLVDDGDTMTEPISFIDAHIPEQLDILAAIYEHARYGTPIPSWLDIDDDMMRVLDATPYVDGYRLSDWLVALNKNMPPHTEIGLERVPT